LRFARNKLETGIKNCVEDCNTGYSERIQNAGGGFEQGESRRSERGAFDGDVSVPGIGRPQAHRDRQSDGVREAFIGELGMFKDEDKGGGAEQGRSEGAED
jgi:hypothetical protein